MKWIRPFSRMVMPTLLFYGLYRTAGILPAITISLGYGLASVIYSKIKENEVKNAQVLGILVLAASAAAVLFTGDEKLYYLPGAIQNALFLGFFLVLSVQRKSVLHYIAKDFEIQSLRRIPEESMLCVNILWTFYCAIKLISKIVGMLYWDFEKLYWAVFLLGDPATILVIILSAILIRLHFRKGRTKDD